MSQCCTRLDDEAARERPARAAHVPAADAEEALLPRAAHAVVFALASPCALSHAIGGAGGSCVDEVAVRGVSPVEEPAAASGVLCCGPRPGAGASEARAAERTGRCTQTRDTTATEGAHEKGFPPTHCKSPSLGPTPRSYQGS